MRKLMRTFLVRSIWLTIALVSGVCFRASADDEKDKAQSPIEVHEWSIWVGNPAQTSINAARIYKNAMPGVAGTSRPKYEDKELAAKFPVSPVSIVQFFG